MGLAARWVERRRGVEARGFGEEMAKIPGPSDGYRTRSSKIVTESTALGHIDVWACVSLIADAIGMLPARAYRSEAQTAPDGSIRMVARKIPRQPPLLVDPMPGEMTSPFSWKHRAVESILTDGNSYSEIGAVDQQGFPASLAPIHPSQVRDLYVNRLGMVEAEMADGGILGSYRDGGTLVHIPGFTKPGSPKGLSPLAAGRQGIGLGMAAEDYGAGWFGDGAHPMGFFKNSRDVSQAEAREVKKRWMATYAGLSREPAYLYGGLEWEQVQITPEESQFIETRQYQAGQIAKLYRVPPHLVGDVTKTTSWGTGIEEQGIGFVVYTLGPWLTRLELALSMLLPRGQYAKLNVSALLRGRMKDQAQMFAIGKQWGWLSTNDIRQMMDMAPIAEGDIYLQPLNMVDAAKELESLLKDDETGDNGRGEDHHGTSTAA